MAAKQAKLEGQVKLEAGSSSGIFTGIAIFVNGYTGELWSPFIASWYCIYDNPSI